MSERDSVHKEIEKLQDEVQETKKKMSLAENRTKHYEEEVSKSIKLDLQKNWKKYKGLLGSTQIHIFQQKINIAN